MKFLESTKPTRFAYGKLISSKSEQPYICQQKWSNEINLPLDEKGSVSASLSVYKKLKTDNLQS